MTTTADHDCEWKSEALALREKIAGLESVREQNAALEARLDKLERALFGKKSEKQPRAAKLTPPVDRQALTDVLAILALQVHPAALSGLHK